MNDELLRAKNTAWEIKRSPDATTTERALAELIELLVGYVADLNRP